MIWDCILNVGGHFENLVKEGKFGEITNNALIPMNSFDLYDWTFLEMEHYWVYNLFFRHFNPLSVSVAYRRRFGLPRIADYFIRREIS